MRSNDAELRAREVLAATKHADGCRILTTPRGLLAKCTCDRISRAMLAFAASERSHDGEWEAMKERCAKVAEDMPKTIPLPDRIIPAHDETDDFGEPLFHVQERVLKRWKHTTPKDVAAAIRSLSAVSLSDDVGCK